MAASATAVIVKRYAGTRLCDPGAGSSVTLGDLAAMAEDDDDFSVTEAATGEDITRSVLKQIIVERGSHG